MFTTLIAALSTLSLTLAAPVSPKALIPDLPPQADLRTASLQILDEAATFSGRNAQYNNYGNFLQTVVPVANTLDQAITHDKVTEIDILADRLCIAGKGQGSLCSEVIAYAYAWYVAQQKGKTYRELATILGPNNMKTINDDLNVLCVGDESVHDFYVELCQVVLEDVDVLANSIIGDSELSEDNNNSNSLEYFGLADLLPAPQSLGL